MYQSNFCEKNKRLLIKLARPRQLFAICVILLFNLIYLQNTDKSVILAHPAQESNHRCSHVPPMPEQVQHVWLENDNFTTQPDEDYTDSRVSTDDRQPKTRRHINGASGHKIGGPDDVRSRQSVSEDEADVSVPAPGSIQDTLWNLIKKLERPITSINLPPPMQSSTASDLVPMRIQVYYDSSVFALEERKLDLIKNSVIPSVVKFFEEALSIRRKYTIDRFRIARGCPNNTIYYARVPTSLGGASRPYCMDRCEDQAICGEMLVPREHLSACSYCNKTSRRCVTDYQSEGVGVANAQLLLYVSAKQTARCKKDQTIAYAAHCAQDSKTDRPVAGHANLCPQSISTDPKDLRGLISTVKHELTHVLGFSVSLFAYYRDSFGRPLLDRGDLFSSQQQPGPIPVDPQTGYAKWSDRVIKKVIRRDWLTGQGSINKEVHMLVTPTVLREVRRHFNCSTLEGAELEDQGSDGTSMTHFEKRLFENEAMTGTHTQNSKYSRITLAVLQDTGWYVVNFTQAERLDWGKDLGCDFAQKSCKSWIDERRSRGQSIRPYCDRVRGEALQIACTDDRTSKAVCNMRRYKAPLPGVYQNFDQLEGLKRGDSELAYYGGSVDLADYCPFIQEFSWQAHNVTSRGSRCDFGVNTVESEKNAALEHYGPMSKCFEHDRRWAHYTCQLVRQWHHYGAGCYRYSCTTSGHFHVIVGNHSYPCYYPGQIIHVEQVVDDWFYNGTLICPSCEKICTQQAGMCQTYDKQIIDLILHHAQSGNILMDESEDRAERSLRSIFEEAYNMIDGNEQAFKLDNQTLSKYMPAMEEASKLIDHRKYPNKTSLLTILRDNAPFLLTLPISKHDDRRLMMCSGTNNIHITTLLNLVSFLLIMTLMLPIPVFSLPNDKKFTFSV